MLDLYIRSPLVLQASSLILDFSGNNVTTVTDTTLSNVDFEWKISNITVNISYNPIRTVSPDVFTAAGNFIHLTLDLRYGNNAV